MKKHYVILVPGLVGENRWLRYIVNSWKNHGLEANICDFAWKDKNNFQSKLRTLLRVIDKIDGKVSLIGTSAGGSAVLNALIERRDKIHKVINVCGRLRNGHNVFPSLELASRESVSFKESVELFESRESLLTNDDRKKALTIKPLFDEIVPLSTIPIEGAKNNQILSVEHILSITLAMTLYSRSIVDFLNES